jgi:AcrR family transcriptional regulator
VKVEVMKNTKNRYFKATLNAVGKTGLNGLVMGELAKSSGMAVGSWYHHFESREALISEVYQFVSGRAASAMITAMEEGSGPGSNIRKMISALSKHWFNNPEEARMFMESEAGQIIPKKSRFYAWNQFEPILEALKSYRESENVRNLPEKDLLSFMLCAVFSGVLFSSRTKPAEMAEMVWHGLKLRKEK